MTKKKIMHKMKMVMPAGAANPGPPIGPALAQFQINIQDFCSKFNEATKDKGGILTPIILTIYKDRSFSMKFKTPPTSELIRRKLGIKKGSSTPNLQKIGKLTRKQLEEIVEIKMPDLNTTDMEQAIKIVSGTAQQMGVEVEIKL